MRLLLLLFFFSFGSSVLAHEDHQKGKETVQEEKTTSWIEWMGSFHLILLHFPIALINMQALSEMLLAIFKKPIYKFSSDFMLISAAILSPLAAIFGLIYGYYSVYTGLVATFFSWHMWFGISTSVLVIALASVKERIGKMFYYCWLALLVLMVNITGFFGGGMTFGPYHLLPPF